MSVWAKNYPEKQIVRLPKEQARQMARHCLAGWKYSCGAVSSSGHRWWHAVDPVGKKSELWHGIELAGVVQIVQREINRRELRNGTLAQTIKASQAQLGGQREP